MYKLTKEGLRKVNTYIKELEAKRKEILDAGKDTAEDTTIPTADDILSEIDYFIDEDGEYCNCWGVTDHYDADGPLCLRFVEDFEDNIHVIPADYKGKVSVICQYTNKNYTDMQPGTAVQDMFMHSFWNVMSNDGTVVVLKNASGGVNGLTMKVTKSTCKSSFVLLEKVLDTVQYSF